MQDCGKAWYRENYIAFFMALRYSYPHLRLIANCDMGDGAPTDLYDWHVYTGAGQLTDSCSDG
jgi:alpha-N-arabinofuranosidase